MSTPEGVSHSAKPEERNEYLWAQIMHARAVINTASDLGNKYRKPSSPEKPVVEPERIPSVTRQGSSQERNSVLRDGSLSHQADSTHIAMTKETSRPAEEKFLQQEPSQSYPNALPDRTLASATSVPSQLQPSVPEISRQKIRRGWHRDDTGDTSSHPSHRRQFHQRRFPQPSRSRPRKEFAKWVRSSDIPSSFTRDMRPTVSQVLAPQNPRHREAQDQLERLVRRAQTQELSQEHHSKRASNETDERVTLQMPGDPAHYGSRNTLGCSSASQAEASKANDEWSNPIEARKEHDEPTKNSIRRQKITAARKQELHELRAEKMAEIRFNMNRHPVEEESYDAASDILQRLRGGEGTDPDSELSKRIAERLIVRLPQEEEINGPREMVTPLRIPDFNKNLRLLSTGHDNFKDIKLWKAYASDTKAYPKVENDMVQLYAEPLPEHLIALRQMTLFAQAVRGGKGKHPPGKFSPNDPNLPKNLLTWDHEPLKPDIDGFDAYFEKWINETMHKVYLVDIFHKSFFDGDSHPDGQTSMFLSGKDRIPTVLDMKDKENSLHRHETADGYRFNYLQLMKSARVSQYLQRVQARNAYLEASRVRHPQAMSPKANIYLRPAERGDVQGLLDIHDWYVTNATQCVEVNRGEATQMNEKIQECRRHRLPFIVAVQRRIKTPPASNRSQHTEKILGYCFASDFMGNYLTSSRYSADVKIFVDHKHKGQGIGGCLMDKLLEVCDPLFVPRQGYFFDADPDTRRMYTSGGARQLTRLIISFCYDPKDQCEYKEVKRWLEKNFDFQEQGVLKGVSFKFEKNLDIGQLVRDVPALGMRAGM